MGYKKGKSDKIIKPGIDIGAAIIYGFSILCVGMFIIAYIFFVDAPLDMNDVKVDRMEKLSVDQYNVDVKIRKDRTVHVEENISVDFNGKKEELFERIYKKNINMYGMDGKLYKGTAKINNICVNGNADISDEGGDDMFVFRLNDPFNLKDGKEQYNVKYDLEFPTSYEGREGEFLMEVMPSSWGSSIKNYSISIEMPREFEKNNLHLRKQKLGYSQYKSLDYEIHGNTIVYKSMEPKEVGEGIAISTNFGRGYFEMKEEKSSMGIWDIIIIVAALVNVISVTIELFTQYNRKKKEECELESLRGDCEFLKKDLCILEVSHLLKFHINKDACRAFMVELMQHGYIDMVEKQGKYFVVKLKDTVEENIWDVDMNKEGINTRDIAYNLCFRKFNVGQEIPLKKAVREVTSASASMDNFMNRRTSTQEKQKESRPKCRNTRIIQGVSSVIFFVLFVMENDIFKVSGITNIFTALVAINTVSCIRYGEKYTIIFFSIISVMLSVLTFRLAGIGIAIGVCIIFVLNIFSMVWCKYLSSEEKLMRTKIKSYHKYLMNMDKEQAENAVKSNENFYYDNLGYAAYFNVGLNYEEAFKHIKGAAPKWYSQNLI